MRKTRGTAGRSMTKIKLCGLTRLSDIETANALRPDHIGMVFAPSRRQVSREHAAELRGALAPGITAVGVFVDAEPEIPADFSRAGIIDAIQLHGSEDDEYIARLRKLTDAVIMQVFRIEDAQTIKRAIRSTADMILLDSGAGTGAVFDWGLIGHIERPYFLAGGLTSGNVGEAVRSLMPYGVDVSSGIETNGVKDAVKMRSFVDAVRKG